MAGYDWLCLAAAELCFAMSMAMAMLCFCYVYGYGYVYGYVIGMAMSILRAPGRVMTGCTV